MTSFGNFGAKKFVDRRIHPTINSQKVEIVGFCSFFCALFTERVDVNIGYGMGTKTFIVHTADGESSTCFEWREEIGNESFGDCVIGINKTDESASGFC